MKKIALFSLLAVFMLSANLFAQNQGMPQPPAPSPILKLTVEEYKANPDKIYVVMFTAVGCQPCRKAKLELLPELFEIFSKGKYQGKVGVYTVDITKGFSADAPYEWKDGVTAMPTFRVLYNKADLYTSTGFSLDKKENLKKSILEAVDSKL